jgi:hypothetical protein
MNFSNKPQATKLATNFVEVNLAAKTTFKYQLDVTLGENGEIPDGMNKISRRVFQRCKKQIFSDYGENALYATKSLYATVNKQGETVYKTTLFKSKPKTEEITSEEASNFEKQTEEGQSPKPNELNADAEKSTTPEKSDTVALLPPKEEEEYWIKIKFLKALEKDD